MWTLQVTLRRISASDFGPVALGEDRCLMVSSHIRSSVKFVVMDARLAWLLKTLTPKQPNPKPPNPENPRPDPLWWNMVGWGTGATPTGNHRAPRFSWFQNIKRGRLLILFAYVAEGYLSRPGVTNLLLVV